MTVEPIVKAIEVPCSQRVAFEIFVEDMNTWWPLERFSVSALQKKPIPTLRVEAQLGGTVVEVSEDGDEYHWANITAFDPYDYLRMDFHIGENTPGMSLVELRFEEVDDGTRVELTQSNWENFGPAAEMLRGGYLPGWGLIFEDRYRAACAAAACAAAASAGPSPVE